MSKLRLASLLVLPLLLGCGGSEKKTEFIFIRHNGVAARCADDVTVRAVVDRPKPDGTIETVVDKVNIGGFYLISPDLKDKPVEEVVKELKAEVVPAP